MISWITLGNTHRFRCSSMVDLFADLLQVFVLTFAFKESNTTLEALDHRKCIHLRRFCPLVPCFVRTFVSTIAIDLPLSLQPYSFFLFCFTWWWSFLFIIDVSLIPGLSFFLNLENFQHYSGSLWQSHEEWQRHSDFGLGGRRWFCYCCGLPTVMTRWTRWTSLLLRMLHRQPQHLLGQLQLTS